MKQSELQFNLISIVVDFAAVLVAAVTAYYLRLELSGLRPILFELPFSQYFQTVLLTAPIMIFLLAITGLYNLKGTRRFSQELLKIFSAVSVGLLIIVLIFFFNQTVFPSRLIILLYGALTFVLVAAGRIVLRSIQVSMLKRGVGLHKLVIIDSTKLANTHVTKEIEDRPELGFRVVAKFNAANIVELIKNLESIRTDLGIDEVLIADAFLDQEISNKILAFCRDYGILFNFVPNLYATAATNIALETISGVPIITLKGTPLDGWGRVLKRIIDIAISTIALIILSPIFLLVAIAIKLNSKGPVLFHQRRAAGLGSFECYKFRSMYSEMSEGTESGDKLRGEIEKQNARGTGPFVKIKNDPRVTTVGRFMRKTKLDEMPQLWHILRGQMSLVGPRVHMIKEVDKFRNEYKHLFVVKPGATGLTQITQATEKPEITWEEEIKLDAFYIENWSIWLDLYIIFKTVLILLGKKSKVDY